MSDVPELAALLSRATELEAALSAAVAAQQDGVGDGTALSYAAQRLQRSVIRPLDEALARSASDEQGAPKPPAREGRRSDADSAALLAGEPLWRLALDATRLRLRPGLPTEVQEATAALQELACQFAPPEADGLAGRLTELKGIQAELPCQIQSQADGPYLVTNVENLTNWLGQRLPTRPQMALCRCGQSAIKPLCDGTHAEIGFTAEKDPKRVPDRRDTYVGQQVTILDNRGICQHSGSALIAWRPCSTSGRSRSSRRAAGGWTRSSARCATAHPAHSASQSMAVEAREQGRLHDKREPAIEVSNDGPYRVTGGIALGDSEGDDEPRNAGRLARALRAVPVRPLTEQAILQRHALVRRLQGPAARPRSRADDLRVVRRPACADAR